MDRLSSDDNGELLLQPIGHCKELIDGLAAMAVDESLSLERRTDSARTLLGITQKAADPNIVYVNARTVRALLSFSGYISKSSQRIFTYGHDVDRRDRTNTQMCRLLTFAAAVVRAVPFVKSMYDSQPATTVVPNRLSSVRELLHEQLRAWLPKFCVAVSNCDESGSGIAFR